METSAITRLAEKALPALSGASLTYIAEKNVYLTKAYSSAAGNSYYKAVRFSDRLAVTYTVGEGWCRVFLNGITLFAWDGTEAVIIGTKTWGGCGNWVSFSEEFATEQTILMLRDYLESQAKAIGQSVSKEQLLTFSRRMVGELVTYQKRIA